MPTAQPTRAPTPAPTDLRAVGLTMSELHKKRKRDKVHAQSDGDEDASDAAEKRRRASDSQQAMSLAGAGRR